MPKTIRHLNQKTHSVVNENTIILMLPSYKKGVAMNLSEVYDVGIVNSILDNVFKNNSGVSSYDLPLDPEDPQRKAFNAWLDGYGIKSESVRDVNYATAYFRIFFLQEFGCIDSSCMCVPDILTELGFGIEVNKFQVFNHKGKGTCYVQRTDSTVDECESCQ